MKPTNSSTLLSCYIFVFSVESYVLLGSRGRISKAALGRAPRVLVHACRMEFIHGNTSAASRPELIHRQQFGLSVPFSAL